MLPPAVLLALTPLTLAGDGPPTPEEVAKQFKQVATSHAKVHRSESSLLVKDFCEDIEGILNQLEADALTPEAAVQAAFDAADATLDDLTDLTDLTGLVMGQIEFDGTQLLDQLGDVEVPATPPALPNLGGPPADPPCKPLRIDAIAGASQAVTVDDGILCIGGTADPANGDSLVVESDGPTKVTNSSVIVGANCRWKTCFFASLPEGIISSR